MIKKVLIFFYIYWVSYLKSMHEFYFAHLNVLKIFIPKMVEKIALDIYNSSRPESPYNFIQHTL